MASDGKTTETNEEKGAKLLQSIVVDDKEFHLDSEMLDGLFVFKHLLERKLIPANFLVKDKQVTEEEQREQYELQRARSLCPPIWGDNIIKVWFNEEQIQSKVAEMGAKISRYYKEQEIVAVGLLNGAVCFMTDLLRHLKVPYAIDFISCSSYGKGTVSKGSPMMIKDMRLDPRGKHILLIEDIIDTGRTLAWLKNYLGTKGCASIRTACFLDKKERRMEKQVHIDFAGFVCPNEFVVGYGMDYAGHYRGLPFIGVLKPEAYES